MITVVGPPRTVVTVGDTSFRSCTVDIIQPDRAIPWHITGHHVTKGVTKHPADNSVRGTLSKGKIYAMKLFIVSLSSAPLQHKPQQSVDRHHSYLWRSYVCT